MTSIIAGLATGLIAAFHFNRYATWGLAANLVAVPIMALWIMPAAILTFVLLLFGLESFGLTLMQAGIELVLMTAHEVSSWDQAVWLVPAIPMSSFVLSMGGPMAVSMVPKLAILGNCRHWRGYDPGSLHTTA